MSKYEYKGTLYSVKELCEISGIKEATIRHRLRQGYSVNEAIKVVATNESVKEFCDASYWGDWIGMLINDLYKIYWKWSVSNGYTPLQKQGFSRQLFGLYPNLKSVPNRNGRVVRER